jgi:hypothetical protein
VEHVAPELQRIFAWTYGTAAMRALRGEGEGGDRTAATDAPVAELEARTRQQLFGCLPHLSETDRAREREAGVTQRFAGSVHEQTTHRFDGRQGRAIWSAGGGGNFPWRATLWRFSHGSYGSRRDAPMASTRWSDALTILSVHLPETAWCSGRPVTSEMARPPTFQFLVYVALFICAFTSVHGQYCHPSRCVQRTSPSRTDGVPP